MLISEHRSGFPVPVVPSSRRTSFCEMQLRVAPTVFSSCEWDSLFHDQGYLVEVAAVKPAQAYGDGSMALALRWKAGEVGGGISRPLCWITDKPRVSFQDHCLVWWNDPDLSFLEEADLLSNVRVRPVTEMAALFAYLCHLERYPTVKQKTKSSWWNLPRAMAMGASSILRDSHLRIPSLEKIGFYDLHASLLPQS